MFLVHYERFQSLKGKVEPSNCVITVSSICPAHESFNPSKVRWNAEVFLVHYERFQSLKGKVEPANPL